MRSTAALVAFPMVLCCAALLGCHEATQPPRPPPPLPTAAEVDVTVGDDEQRCEVDEECVLTTVDCCGCNALGRQTAVRKDRLLALTERRRPICSTIACAQGMSDDPSCSASRARCLAGRCTADAAAAVQRGVGVEKIAN